MYNINNNNLLTIDLFLCRYAFRSFNTLLFMHFIFKQGIISRFGLKVLCGPCFTLSDLLYLQLFYKYNSVIRFLLSTLGFLHLLTMWLTKLLINFSTISFFCDNNLLFIKKIFYKI